MTNGEVGRFPLSVQVMSIGDMCHFYGEQSIGLGNLGAHVGQLLSRTSFAPGSANDEVALFLSFGRDEP